jgi:acyl-CoA thioesterase FadM
MPTTVRVNQDVMTADVDGVALPPFISIRDGSLDAKALAHVGSFLRRAAYKHGWLQGLNPTISPPGSEASTVKPTMTVFMAGQLFVLEVPSKYRFALPTDATCDGHCAVIQCGTSSYTVSTEVTAPDPATGAPRRVGYCIQTFVGIDLGTRRPTPLPEAARVRVGEVLALHGEGRLAPPQRLNSQSMRPPREADFSFATRVRPFSDFDFNGHLNQGVYTTLAFDAVQSLHFERDPTHLHPSMEVVRAALQSSFDFVAVRIDYLAEITDGHATIQVDLWADSPLVAALDFVQAAAKQYPQHEHHSLWFEITSGERSAQRCAIGVIVVRTQRTENDP